MSVAEYLHVSRKLTLAPAGGTKTLTLESGTPYRHYVVWTKIGAATINVNFQPKFGGQNDGGVINVANSNPTKIFQIAAEEVRPPTRGIGKHPEDNSAPLSLKSELVITNAHATAVAEVSVYMLASATPGGA